MLASLIQLGSMSQIILSLWKITLSTVDGIFDIDTNLG